MLTEVGPVQVDVPRDRAGTFEPVIVPKGKRRLEGVDRIVLSLTARGLTTGEISAHFAEVYGASIAKDTISRISDRVIEEMTEWLHRPLDEGRFPVILANPELEGSQCHVEDTTEHQLRPSVATSS